MSCLKAVVLGLSLVLPTLGSAQPPRFRTPSLAALRHDAVESTNITVGPLLLWFASRVIGNDDPHSAAIKSLLRGLHKVQVHDYIYDTDRTYRQEDLQSIRDQFTKPGWQRVVQARHSGAKGDVDIYYALDKGTVVGLVLLDVEPREFTLINISGTIDFKNVATLCDTIAPKKNAATPLALTSPEVLVDAPEGQGGVPSSNLPVAE